MRPSSDMAIPGMPAAMEAEHTGLSPAPRRKRWSRLLLFGPALLFLGLVAAFALGLRRDPKLIPSPLIGKPVPDFALPPVKGRSLGLATSDLKGEVSLVNVFASWCVACREEHPVLMRLAGSMGWVIPIPALGPTSEGGSPSTGVFTACPKPLSSIHEARSPSSR